MTITLHNADCFDVFPTLADASIDLVCADIPYGTTQCRWDSVLDLQAMWQQLYRRQPTYNPQFTHGHERKTSKRKTVNSECYGKALELTEYDSTTRYPRDVQFFSSDKQTGNYHPTQKPLALVKYLIETYSNPGDTVLDFTMGSGTSGVACQGTGRLFIGIEKEKTIFQVACQRMGIKQERAA